MSRFSSNFNLNPQQKTDAKINRDIRGPIISTPLPIKQVPIKKDTQVKQAKQSDEKRQAKATQQQSTRAQHSKPISLVESVSRADEAQQKRDATRPQAVAQTLSNPPRETEASTPAQTTTTPVNPSVTTTSSNSILQNFAPEPEAAPEIADNQIIGNSAVPVVPASSGVALPPEITVEEEIDPAAAVTPPRAGAGLASAKTSEEIREAEAEAQSAQVDADIYTNRFPSMMPESRENSVDYDRTRTLASKMHQSDASNRRIGFMHGAGQGVSEWLTADQRMPLDEVSFGTKLFLQAYDNPNSQLREIVSEDWLAEKNKDKNQMVQDIGYLEDVLIEFFSENEITLLVSKNPVPDEPSSHLRIVRLHKGVGARVHPIVAAVYNADHDGDSMSVSFNADMAQGAKSSMDFLIGTEGDLKIDPDFFAMVRWGRTHAETAQQLTDLFASEGLKLPKKDLRRLVKAIDLSSGEDNGTVEEGYLSLMHAVRSLGDKLQHNPRLASKVTATVLRAIYRHNGDIRKIQNMVFGASTFEWDQRDNSGIVLDDISQQPFYDDITQGGFPANIGDLKAMLGGPVSAVEGKNFHYRIDAAFAKEVKRRFNLTLESDTLINEKEVAEVAMALVTKQLANVSDFKEVSNAVSSMMREMIIDESLGGIGKPDIDNFASWMEKFTQRYNMVAYKVNAASIDIRLDMTTQYNDFTVPFLETGKELSQAEQARLTPEQLEARITANTKELWAGKLRQAFTNIYGSFTMEDLFPGVLTDDRLRPFRDYTLADFAISNRSTQYLSTMKDNHTLIPRNFVLLLADQRSSFAATYNERLAESLQKMFTDNEGKFGSDRTWFSSLLAKSVHTQEDGTVVNTHSRDGELLTVIEAFNLLGPEVFYHFNLDNLETFATSELGRKIVRAQTPDQLGGILYEAVARYRWYPIQKWQKQYELVADDPIRQAQYTELIEEELQSLRSSSDTWAAIVNDYTRGGNAFESILLNDSLGQKEKDLALNQLQKSDSLGWINQQDWMIAADLMANPKGLYSSNRFLSDFGHTTLLENLKESNKKLDGYVKSNHEAYVKQVKYARKKAGAKIGPYLNTIAKNPELLSEVNREMFADAVLAGLDISFASSEKAKQESIINALYTALSRRTNGGLFSELKVADSFFMERIHEDDFRDWSMGMARIIADPSFKIRVFNDSNPVGSVISRETIFGTANPSHEQLWDWLEANPRAAMALRTGSSLGTAKGKAYQIATRSLLESITHTTRNNQESFTQDKAFQMLAQHPYFAAIVALSVEQKGMKAIQLREETIEATERTIRTIRMLASQDDPESATREYVEALVAQQDLSALSGSENALEDDIFAGYNTSEFYGATGPDQVIEHLITHMGKYARMLKDAGLESQNDSDLITFAFGDSTSLRSYFKTIEMFSGAKTQIDTSTNARESQENAAMIYLSGRVESEPCDAPEPEGISIQDFLENWSSPLYHRHQARTPNGGWIPVKESTIDRIISIAHQGDGLVYIESVQCHNPLMPCKRHGMADMSTNTRFSTQTTALSRMMTTLRTWASEKLNLKVKTKGDDGTDLVVKRKILSDNWTQHEETIRKAFFETPGMDGVLAARLELAKIMQSKWGKVHSENPNAMDYDAMSLDDYTNIAQYLVRPMLDEEGNPTDIIILSIGQLNALVRGAIIDHHLKNPGKAFKHAELAAVARTALAAVGYAESQDIDVHGLVAKLNVSRKQKYRTGVVSPRRSSWERNAQLLNKIFEENPNAAVPTYTAMSKQVNWFAGKYPGLVDMFPQWLGVEKNRSVDTEYSYNFLGLVDSNSDTRVKAPGPKTMWVMMDTAASVPGRVQEVLKEAHDLGITVLFPNEPSQRMLDALAESDFDTLNGSSTFLHQLVPVDGGIMLPMFELRLNGENTTLNEGISNIGVTRMPDSSFSILIEDPGNFYDLSDSDAQATESAVNRIRPKKDGEYRSSVRSMFGNVLDSIKNTNIGLQLEVKQATREQIEHDIIGGNNLSIDTGRRLTPALEQQMQEDIQRYIANFDNTDSDGVMTGAVPNTVVAWVRGELLDSSGNVRRVYYHPLKMYPTDNPAGAPANFEITGCGFDHATQSFVLKWQHRGSLLGQLFKLFESGYAANKFMVRDRAIPSLKLRDGSDIDFIVAAASTAKRRGPIQRVQSMGTLLTKARLAPWGYNLADLESDNNPEGLTSFPNDPELKEGLRDGTLRLGDWKQRLDSGEDIVFYSGESARRNAFANLVAKKCIMAGVNPSVFFATKHNGIATQLHFNYQAVMESTNGYQNGLMTFLNDMIPELVPPTMTSEDTNTLFNNKLQLLMPVPSETGEKAEQWVYAYINNHFLDEHYSGFSASGSNIRSTSLPVLNTLGFGGKELTELQNGYYTGWGGLVPASYLSTTNSLVSEHTETFVAGDE